MSRRKSRKLDNHEIKFTSGIVPSSPKPLLPTEREEDVLGNISAKEAELILNRLKELFDERPIWTRNAIRIMLLPITKKLDDINARWLSPALSRISYLFT